MKLTITIDLGNAAFEGDQAGPSVAGILRRIADDLGETAAEISLEFGGLGLRDINGNTVGRVEVEED